MAKPSLDFWFDFASTYSYPAAMRIASLAETSGVTVRWRPFMLGPIFKAQGWATSPFNLYPAKGRNMWRDLERICAALDLPFKRPDPFPQNSLLAARAALVALASYYGSDISFQLENTTDVTPVANALQLAAAAGILGGLAYWLIAGRNAGRWREPREG